MIRNVFFAFLLLTSGLTTPAMAAFVVPKEAMQDDALAIARILDAKAQFRAFVLQTLRRTTTGQILVNRVGQQKADQMFAFQTVLVTGKYEDEWESNFAQSYREALSTDELAKLLSRLRVHDMQALSEAAPKVGPIMEKKSMPLLQKAGTEALTALFDEATKDPK